MSCTIGIQNLWSYVLAKCPEGCKSVDLSAIARQVIDDVKNNPNLAGVNSKSQGRLNLVVDTRDCFDRLYGGFYNDWICGGGWNRMTTFLQELNSGLHKSHIRIVPIFNGSVELAHLDEWHQQQLEIKDRLTNIFKYLSSASVGQWKPPPKVWWVAPSGLEVAMRMAFRHLNVNTVCTTEDHSQEAIDYCREHNHQGLLCESALYMIFQPPRLFSALSLKLKFTGRIDITEFDMDAIARGLDLHPNRFILLAALLGNHILSAKDLKSFYSSLMEKEAISEEAVEPDVIIDCVLGFLRRLDNIDPDAVGTIIFRNSPQKTELIAKLKESIQYYANGTKEGFEKFRPKIKNEKSADGDKSDDKKDLSLSLSANGLGSKGSSGKAGRVGAGQRTMSEGAPFFAKHNVSAQLMVEASERAQKGTMHPWIYQVLSEGSVKMGIGLENEAAYDLPLSVDLYRSIRQLVYGVLFDTHKSLIKSEGDKTTVGGASTGGAAGDTGSPRATPVTQKEKNVVINEWVVRKTELTSESVEAIGFDWKTPTSPCETLWYGKSGEDKNRRLRSFMSCMGHDLAPMMVDTSYVPPHYVILCCVLRYLLKQRVIREMELRAFLAQAVNPMLHNVDFIMQLELPYINPRAVQLATLFMKGVEHAIFANDACGAPIPWNFTCPWNYFDGKLFQYTYQMFECGEPLPKACGFQSINLFHSLQEAILAGLHPAAGGRRMIGGVGLGAFLPPTPDRSLGFPNEYLDLAYGMHPGQGGPRRQPGGQGSGGMPGGGPPGGPFPASQYVPMPRQQQGEGGGHKKGMGSGMQGGGGNAGSGMDFRGGKLEVGGIVVSNWGPNIQAASGRGRGRDNFGAPNNSGYGSGYRGGMGISQFMPSHYVPLGGRQMGGGRGMYGNNSGAPGGQDAGHWNPTMLGRGRGGIMGGGVGTGGGGMQMQPGVGQQGIGGFRRSTGGGAGMGMMAPGSGGGSGFRMGGQGAAGNMMAPINMRGGFRGGYKMRPAGPGAIGVGGPRRSREC